MKPGSLIVEIHHNAWVNAAYAGKMQHCRLIDFNALQGSTLNHGNIQKLIQASEAVIRL